MIPLPRFLMIGAVAVLMVGGVGATSVTPVAAKEQAPNWTDQQITGGIRGVDVSRWQHGYRNELSFKKLRKSGVRFAIIKASDGNKSEDRHARKWFKQDRPAARRARLVVGTYHYGRPTSNVEMLESDAREEARQAASRLGKYVHGYLPTALDLEKVPANLTPEQVSVWALTWLQTYEQLTGRQPMLYSYRYFIDTKIAATPPLTNYPLWFAHYGVKQGERPAPIARWPESAPTIWQFSSRGRLPGSGSTNIDLNIYFGTGDQLRRFARMSEQSAHNFGLI